MRTTSPSSAASDPTSCATAAMTRSSAIRCSSGSPRPRIDPERLQVPEGPVGLRACPADQVLSSGFVAGAGGQLVEEEPERVQRVVQLVQDGGHEHPDGLVALDLVQARAERLGARCGFLRGRELRSQSQVVRTHAQQSSDQDRGGVVDERVRPREAARERAAFRCRDSERMSKTT